jgi:hypothetical protein
LGAAVPGAALLVALAGAWLLAGCGPTAAAQPATPPAEVTPSPTRDPADPLSPLARRQATAQAQLAAEFQAAAAEASTAVSARDQATAEAAAAIAADGAAQRDIVDRALAIIRVADTGPLQEIANTTIERKVPIAFGPLPRDVLGVWDTRKRTITISDRYRNSPIEGIAGILVHEATHAYDFYRGRMGRTRADCYDIEGRAFGNQARLWEALYGKNGKPKATDPVEKEMNEILQASIEHPTTFAVDLLLLYHHQCS